MSAGKERENTYGMEVEIRLRSLFLEALLFLVERFGFHNHFFELERRIAVEMAPLRAMQWNNGNESR